MNFKECILIAIHFENWSFHLFLPTLTLWLIFSLKTAKSMQPIIKDSLVGKHSYIILNMLYNKSDLNNLCFTSRLLVCIKYMGLYQGRGTMQLLLYYRSVNKWNNYQNRTSWIISKFYTLSTGKDNLKIKP